MGDLLMARFGTSCDPTESLSNTQSENTPTVIHIFSFPSANKQFVPKLRSILIHNQPVLHAQWNPIRKGSLALCCGNRSVYTWSEEWMTESGSEEEIAECIGIPASMSTHLFVHFFVSFLRTIRFAQFEVVP